MRQTSFMTVNNLVPQEQETYPQAFTTEKTNPRPAEWHYFLYGRYLLLLLLLFLLKKYYFFYYGDYNYIISTLPSSKPSHISFLTFFQIHVIFINYCYMNI